MTVSLWEIVFTFVVGMAFGFVYHIVYLDVRDAYRNHKEGKPIWHQRHPER